MYRSRQRHPTRRLAGLAGVVLFHAALIYGLVNGLGQRAVEVLRAPLEAKLIAEIKPPPPPPPP
ncbi:MAG: energy transducer TonB, partial [Magnetospirillum sp.]|nr:energy transducer TonB [Magnetospirillum sp.]